MVIKIMSKFEIARYAKALSAPLLTKLGAPTKEEIGECD